MPEWNDLLKLVAYDGVKTLFSCIQFPDIDDGQARVKHVSKKYNGEIISDVLRRDIGEDIEYFNRKNDGSSLRRLREDIRQRFEQVLKNIKRLFFLPQNFSMKFSFGRVSSRRDTFT